MRSDALSSEPRPQSSPFASENDHDFLLHFPILRNCSDDFSRRAVIAIEKFTTRI
jgi:hypothetical protein